MSLRTKQALILFLATVLPFALGAAAVDWVVAPAYRREVSRSLLEATERLSDHVAWNLARDISRLQKLASWNRLAELAQQSRMTEAQAQELERRWPKLLPESEPVRTLLENPVAWELYWWQRTDVSAVEVFATDARGRLVAASRKPSDFIQADERWWREAYDQGRGRVYVSELAYDDSAGNWGLEAAVPIFASGAPRARVVGVLKMVLDARRTFQDVKRTRVEEGGRTVLVDRLGRIVVSQSDAAPLAHSLRQPGLSRLKERPAGVTMAGSGDRATLIAWAEVALSEQIDSLPARTPSMYVVAERSTAEAFAPLRTVQRWMVIIAILTIALAVCLGYWLADLWLVRHIRTLAAGMRELASGDFRAAAAIADRLPGGNGKSEPEREREVAGLPE
jgi:hypothetical protein